MNFIRQALYALWFYLSLAIIGILGLPFAMASHQGVLRVMKAWCRVQVFGVRWLCGVKTEFRGLENLPEGGCLIAMKHQSTFDIIAPFLILDDPAFTPKEQLLKAPIFGYYVKRARMIFLDRAGGAKTMRLLLSASKGAVEEGRQVLIFPEGTRQEVGAPPDYKPGVAGIYRTLKVPCIPIAVNTGVSWPGKTFPSRPGRIIIEVLPAIPAGLDRDTFMHEIENAIEPASTKLAQEVNAKI